jgi:hypothetical protein
VRITALVLASKDRLLLLLLLLDMGSAFHSLQMLT